MKPQRPRDPATLDSAERDLLPFSGKIDPGKICAVKASRSWHPLAIPAVLLAGFVSGFVLRGPVLEFTAPVSPEEGFTEASAVTVHETVKKKETKTTPSKSSQTAPGWDEKTIRALGLAEIKNRLNQLASWAPGPEADRVERWLIKRWATLEPREACQYAYVAVLQGAEISLLEGPLRVWAETSPVMASAWAGSLGSPSIRDFAVRLVFGIWAGKDSSAAVAGVAKLRSAAARTAATMAVAPPQAQKNFTAAMSWARGLPGSKRQKTLEEILGEWTRRDPASAATWLIQQPGDVQWSLVAKLAADWVRKDPATALRWGQGNTAGLQVGSQMASGPVQRKFMEAALANLIGADPEAAASWLASSAGQTYLDLRAAPLAARWTALEAQEAATWALNLPESPARNAAIGAVAGTWGRIDPQEAGSWIEKLPSGSSRDTALQAYSTAISAYDAPVAAGWANGISQPGPREAAFNGVFKQWEKMDPAAARTFILQKAQLSPAAQKRILQ